jgi:sialic acid synthase SpsE
MQKNAEKNISTSIYDLVSELSTSKPDTKTLKSLCESCGLVYESDLVLLMSKVLVMANSTPSISAQYRKNQKSHYNEA